MLISFDCPKCLKIARSEVSSASTGIMCTECGWKRPILESDHAGEAPTRCLVCGCDDLWRQKEFDQRLGVFIVGLGILISTIFVAKMMPGAAMMVLLAFGLADYILYAILPDRLVCYRCHSQYHRVPQTAATAVFDLEINERYRQEAIRMKQSEQAAKQGLPS